MKILLQNKPEGLFLSSTGDWEPTARNAWEFDTTADAIKYCMATKIWNVGFILRFSQAGRAVDVPLEETSFAVSPDPMVSMALGGRVRSVPSTLRV